MVKLLRRSLALIVAFNMVFFSLVPICKASAALTFFYHSSSVQFSVHMVSGGPGDSQLLSEVRKALPLVLGFEEQLRESGKALRIDLSCQSAHVASYQIGNQPLVTMECSGESPDSVIQRILQKEKYETRQVRQFSGFSVQITTSLDAQNASNQLQAWKEKLMDKRWELIGDGETFDNLEAMAAVGDYTMTPIWLNRSTEEGTAIQYGIFHDRTSAEEAIKLLGLSETDVKILRLQLDIEHLDEYFR